MSVHVHRNGAHMITVQDDDGREAVLTSQDRTLQVSTTGSGPRLTPQMAHELAEVLHQWAECQQTVRTGPRVARAAGDQNGSDQPGEPV